MIAVAFLLVAATGAALRALITDLDAGFNRQMYGTAAVNIVGSFILGLLHNSSASTIVIIGVGGLGALTTFSTFVSQIECINREGTTAKAALYAVGTLTLSVGAAWVGWSLF